jgi:hypothetical protein
MVQKLKALVLWIVSAIPVAVSAQTTYETIPAGSFIVNMGGTQSVSTLKAYGLLFNLMRGQYVPVKWCINPSKGKDGVDFTIGTTSFSSGAFVVPKQYRNSTVNSIISTWQGKGVSGITTTSDVVLPVFTTFSAMQRWYFVLDLKNGSIAQGYLRNAEIPDSVSGFVDPKNLNCCHDFFVMPHADPIWTTHSRLYTWTQSVANGGCRGSVWAACHAVSALENMINPGNFSQQTNFLTTISGTAAGISSGWANPPNSLVLWKAHGGGTPPYSYRHHSDPEMQFLGTLDAATQNGSEQIYLPVSGAGWRSTTKVGVWDPDYVFGGVTLSGSREAAVVAWGRAKGDADAGFVMYEAGHSHNKATSAANIAAQRAFFNASLMAGVGGTTQNNNSIRIVSQSASGAFVLQSGSLNFGIKIAGGAGTYTFRSINNCGGSLTTTKIGADSARLVYTAPSSVSGITDCYITVIARDGCGRETFYSWPVRISPTPVNNPPVARPDTLILSGSCAGSVSGSLNVLPNDSEPDGQPLSAELLTVNNGTATLSANGNFVFTVNPGFQGVTTATYRACDNVTPTPACSTSTIRIQVGTQDSKGCWGSESWGLLLEEGADSALAGAQVGLATGTEENALGDPDGTGTTTDNKADRLVIGFSGQSLNAVSDTLYLTWDPVNSGSGSVTVSLELSTNGTTWGTAQTASSSSTSFIVTPFNVNVTNARWARIAVTSGENREPQIDALVFRKFSCQSKQQTAVNDVAVTNEDRAVRIRVLDNDESAPGLPDSVFNITVLPRSGSASLNADQTITYQPNTDFDGKDSFTYRICNRAGFCSDANVNVTVAADACAAGSYGSSVTNTNTTITTTRDAFIYQRKPNDDYGTDDRLNVGWADRSNREYRSVLWFDLSGISASATVTSARLELYRDGEDNNQTVNIHAINGSGVFVESGSNSVTWNNRNANAWATAGGDFSSTVQGTLGTGTSNGWKNSSSLQSLVQSWVSTPSGNLGLLLDNPIAYSKNVRARFDARERGANDPLLRVTYTTVSGCTAIPNRAPHMRVDLDTTMFPTPKYRNVVSNDSDPEGTTLNLTATNPILLTIGGTATRSGNVITFTPSSGFNGWASVLYRITDGTLIDTGYYRIFCLNAPPVAVKDSATISAIGGSVTVNVSANDYDHEGSSLTTSIIRQGTKGNAVLSGNNIQYTSIAPLTGLDTVWYAVTEPAVGVCAAPKSDTAILVIRIINRQPDAKRDTAYTFPCQTKQVDVLANDTDPDGHSLNLTGIISGPFHGSASILNGEIGYTPNSTPTPFTGTDSLRYAITDNGDPQRRDTATLRIVVNILTNGKPVALNDTIFVQKGQTWYEPVLDNDSDPDGDNLIVFRNAGVKAASNGTVTVLPNNLLVYVPDAGFVGKDTFAYIIKDTFAVTSCSPPGVKYDTALVFVYVEFLPPNGVNMTVAVNDYNNTWVNTPVSGNVLTNDFDPEGNNISFGDFLDPVTQLAISSGDTLRGIDANGNPVTSAGVLTFTNGAYAFTPINGFAGIAIVDYNICDDGNPSTACDIARLTISVDPMPEYSANNVIANNDFNVISYGKSVGGVVLLNDKDPEGDNFEVTAFRYDSDGDGIPDANGTLGTPVHIAGVDFTGSPVASAGLLTLNANGIYTFKPDSFLGVFFVGTVTVEYRIEDDGSPVAIDDALLVINVLPDNGASNDPPFAGDDFVVTESNTAVTGNWAGNDREPNSDDIRINGVTTNIDLDNLPSPGTAIDTLTTVEGGTVIFFTGGTFRYTPPSGYIGPDRVIYNICDVTAITPQPLCASATIYLLVETDNSTVAVNDYNNTWVNTPVTGDVTSNDFDPEGDTQDFGSFLNQNGTGSTISSGATLSGIDPNGNTVSNAGALTFNGNGGYSFTPANGFVGVVTVPYSICDDGNPGKCDTVILRVSVDMMPTYGDNNVIANNDFSVSYGGTVTGDVDINDSDPEGNSFSVVSYRRDTNGDGVPDASGTLGSATTVAGLDINGRPWTNAGSLTLNTNGTYSFTPVSGFIGTVTTEYRIDDNGSPVANDLAMLVIKVLQNNGPLNDPPFAGDDFAVTMANDPVNGNWAGNDRELNGDSIRINGIPTKLLLTGLPGTASPIDTVTTSEGGTVILYNNGTFRYTPPLNYHGPDQLVYEICDITAILPTPLCAQATIYFLVHPENRTEAAIDQALTWVNSPVTGNVIRNDFDPESDSQTFGSFLNQNGSGTTISSGSTLSGVDTSGTAFSNAGTLTYSSNGTFTFVPANGFAGIVNVPYSICDDVTPQRCDTAMLRIKVIPLLQCADNLVIAVSDVNVSYYDPTKGTAKNISGTVLRNDYDPQGQTITVTAYRYDADGDGLPETSGTLGSSIDIAGKDRDGNIWSKAGTFTLNSNGTYIFVPDSGFLGYVAVEYSVEDNNSPVKGDDIAYLDMYVFLDALNDPPFAGNDQAFTLANTSVINNWAEDDYEPNGDSIRLNGSATKLLLTGLSATATPIDTVTTDEGGQVIFFANGTFRYAPAPGFIGSDRVNYEICDVTDVVPTPLCAQASILLLVSPDNFTVAVNDFNNTWQYTPVSGNVMVNDFDCQRDTQDFGSFLNQNSSGSPISSGATLIGVDPGGNPVSNAGTITFTGNGLYTFTPAGAFTGTVIVPYYVCDNGIPGICDTAILRISVDPLPYYSNNTLIANNDFNVTYGTTIGGDITDNDHDPEGTDVFEVVSYQRDTDGDGVVDASGTLGSATVAGGVDIYGNHWANAGSLNLAADGTYTFTPANGFSGLIKVEYIIEDNGTPSTATDNALLAIKVIIDNGPLNDPPFTGDDYDMTKINTPVLGNWALNDNEPNGDSVLIAGKPLFLSGLPSSATPFDTLTTLAGGSLIMYQNGSYLYTPPADYIGPDQVSYRICDVTDVLPQPLCHSATIYLLVNPENSTVAANDFNNTWVNTPVTGDVSTNDFDPEGDTQDFGSFLNQNGTGSTISTGAALSGVDTSGASVSNAGTISFTGTGGYTFTPASGFAGKVTVPYNICDDGNPSKCDTAILTITVEAFPDPNVNSVLANNDFNVSYGDTIGSTVLVNDFDREGDNFEVISYRRDTNGDGEPDAAGTVGSFTTVAGMAKNGKPWTNAGSLRLNTDGSYTFAPAAGFVGTVTMRYTIEDDGSPVAKDDALLVIKVLQNNGPLNDPPFAGDDYAFTKVDVPVDGNWAGNDQEPNRDSIRINGVNVKLDLKGLPGTGTPIDTVTTDEGGTVIFRSNGTYTYTPLSGYIGPDHVTYEICDVTAIVPTPLCAQATLCLLVGSENSTLAVNDFNNTWVNTPVSGDVITNDADPEGDVRTFGSFLNQNGSGSTISTGATLSGFDRQGNPISNAGVLVFNTGGGYTFTPASGFTGKVTVPYNICDNGAPSKCDTAHLTIKVDSLPGVLYNSVIANNDFNISFGAAVGGNVLSNDGDAEGDNIDVTGYRRDTDGDGIPDASGTIGSAVTVAGVDRDGAPVTNAGSLTLNANGTYSFTTAAGFIGTVTQQYFIEDDNAETAYDTALLVINVLRDNGPANDPPFAGDDFAVTVANTPVMAPWAANDAEPNDDSIRLNGKTINLKLGALPGTASPVDTVATVEGGSVVFFTNGVYTYTPPMNFVGPDQVTYEICDVTTVLPQPLCAQATVYLLVPPAEITISGTVFRDGNGLTDSLVNGTPIGSIGGSALYAYLIEQGRVIDSARVASNGTYSFTSGRMLGDYRIAISTRQKGIKTSAPFDADLPFSFKPVGETYGSNNLAGNGIDLTGSNGLVTMRTGHSSTTATNFGIQYAPIAHPKSYTVNPDSLTNVTGSTLGTFIRRLTLNAPSGSSDTAFTGVTGDMPGVLSGYDDEDGRFNGVTGAMNMSMVLDSLPDTTNALLEYIYNGQVYNLWPNPTSTMTRNALIFWDTAMKKYVIPGFDADSLRMLFKFAYQVNTQFYYSYLDSAGVKGPAAPYTINYLSPLPVEIIHFGCRERQGGMLVSWVTAMEENSDYFAMLRSADGREWKRVGTVQAAGFSAQLRNYSWFDAQPMRGINYYRVLAVDRNGYEESTEICFTRFNSNVTSGVGSVIGYPNPTTGRMTIEVNAAMEGRVNLVLATAAGNQIIRHIENATRGSNYYELDLSEVVPGVYMLRLEGAGIQVTYRVIRQ